MPTFDSDRELTVLGVTGRLTHRTTKPGQAPGLWFKQVWISTQRPIQGYGHGAQLRAEMRFDDECGNGHNTFAITGEVRVPGRRDVEACGCLHDDITRVFPELAPLIKWHLCSTDGPMHYLANTVYFAGDRDHYGKRKGEARSFDTFVQFGDNPIKHAPGRKFVKWLESCKPFPGNSSGYDFEVLAIYHSDQGKPGKHQYGPKYTFGGFAERWHECPFDSEQSALDFLYALQMCNPKFVRVATAWGEGKEREFEKARNAAIWHGATNAQLSVESVELKEKLIERLPALIAEFRAAIESTGFLWSPEGMAPKPE